MTGRDLIVYILQNNLEDTPVFEDGRFLGFITDEEAAIKYNVGIATIRLWIDMGLLKGIKICDKIYIPDCETPTVC